MAGSRKIRAAMKKLFEPFLANQGFTGKYPHFQRKESGELQLLSVIYDKWGGGFVLEFARHPSGVLHTSWGTVVPEEEIDVAYTSPSTRARLVRTERGQGCCEDFFRYEKIADDREQCEALVSCVVGLFPQVNEWLRKGNVGPNISPFLP
jgi:hypothetical protein